MALVILVYLNILYTITSGLSKLSHDECRYVSKGNVPKMCKSVYCVKDPSVASFCEHVYGRRFKCQSKYLPFRFICDGINQCTDGSDEDPIACSYITCEKNFFKCQGHNHCIHVSKICNGVDDCLDGYDESPSLCKNLIGSEYLSCPAIFEKTHVATCHIKFGNMPRAMSCEGFLPPETVVKVRCKNYFHLENSASYQLLRCQYNGTWDRDILKCNSDCGIIVNTKITPLIINGSPIIPTIWPWFAALYSPINDKWEFFCSSTIISSNTLLTAAHCVWNLPTKGVKVTAGKAFSDFYRHEPTSQVSDVRNILIHPLYQDSLGNYGSDIAIIKLKNPFTFSESVLPVCMNWTLRNIIVMDSSFEGKVAGMGITENASISNELRVTSVKVVKNEDCLRNQRFEFRKYITISSFCAKGETEEVVCNGDSGSGLAIRSNTTGKWIIEGIVSISPKNPYRVLCDKNYYSIYTKVGMYTNWIYENFY